MMQYVVLSSQDGVKKQGQQVGQAPRCTLPAREIASVASGLLGLGARGMYRPPP